MSDDKLQKRGPSTIKEKGQLVLAFSVVASMLLVTGFNVFVIFFFGLFGYLLLKMFASGSRSETREIFEFYLSANEILRDDERRWYGFEITDAIMRGESILQRMSSAPPLVYFTLGALYNKIGDHNSAVRFLTRVLEDQSTDEAAYVFPSPELRSYVKVLRKIERDPADAPMTSAAVRALERARKIRGKSLLEESRERASELNAAAADQSVKEERAELLNSRREPKSAVPPQPSVKSAVPEFNEIEGKNKSNTDASRDKGEIYSSRKPITEVLHDIYDGNVQ